MMLNIKAILLAPTYVIYDNQLSQKIEYKTIVNIFINTYMIKYKNTFNLELFLIHLD